MGRRLPTLLVTLLLAGCKQEPDAGSRPSQQLTAPSPSLPAGPSGAKSLRAGVGEPAANGDAPGAATSPSRPPQPAAQCPSGMHRVPGGKFWVGTERETYEREENPRFETQLPEFCAGVMEVSATEYEACVAAGKCSPSHAASKTCNTTLKGRGDHPINCIDHAQATAVCTYQGGRLPSEVEWEYLARGGAEMREYPWGGPPVDGNTCWKSNQSCPRGSFTVGAFGLHDVVGNVWEWTESWFGPYPWPAAEGRHKVYRGGSWSRRFDKWMRAGLRNRLDPEKYGSHLGVRCVADLPDVPCPYGRDGNSARCSFGVDRVMCLGKESWNGARCVPPGETERCPAGAAEVPGRGCVAPTLRGGEPAKLDLDAVARVRSPEFDADCSQNGGGRPHAYRFTGGGHLARNAVGKGQGCKNRDVGVGWNSACCP